MRHSLSAAALVLAAATVGVAAGPQSLTPVEMDRVTAGSTTTKSYTVSETSEFVRGKHKKRLVITEHVSDGDRSRTRRVEVVNGKVTAGDPALYKRYKRDQAKARRALKKVLPGLERLNDFNLTDLDFGNFVRGFVILKD